MNAPATAPTQRPRCLRALRPAGRGAAERRAAASDGAGASAAVPPAAPAAPQVAPPAAASAAPARLPPARQALADGIHQYYVGLYAASLQSLGEALQLGLDGPVDQVSAHKFLALDHCAAGRQAACRAEFGLALQIFPEHADQDSRKGAPIRWIPWKAGRTLAGSRPSSRTRKPGSADL